MSEEEYAALEARERIAEARRRLADALEAVSGPAPDWARCSVCVDMAADALPAVRRLAVTGR